MDLFLSGSLPLAHNAQHSPLTSILMLCGPKPYCTLYSATRQFFSTTALHLLRRRFCTLMLFIDISNYNYYNTIMHTAHAISLTIISHNSAKTISKDSNCYCFLPNVIPAVPNYYITARTHPPRIQSQWVLLQYAVLLLFLFSCEVLCELRCKYPGWIYT